jgi:hypothetical protein
MTMSSVSGLGEPLHIRVSSSAAMQAATRLLMTTSEASR